MGSNASRFVYPEMFLTIVLFAQRAEVKGMETAGRMQECRDQRGFKKSRFLSVWWGLLQRMAGEVDWCIWQGVRSQLVLILERIPTCRR